VKDEQTDTIFTKQFKAVIPLAFKTGDWSKNELVLQTTDYDLLKTYDRNLEDIVALGWGILDGLTVMPLYRCLAS
jgi:YidC/Oxa1 family membrane protein insertase